MIIRNLIALSIFCIICVASASAQRCRVSCGVRADGTTIYREVYEYNYVTVKPSFPGGDCKMTTYVNSERHYPEAAYKNRVQGRVTCSFIVNPDGSISHVQVVRGVEASLNAEAIRILSNMPEWIPGKMGSHAVPVRLTYTIPFRR